MPFNTNVILPDELLAKIVETGGLHKLSFDEVVLQALKKGLEHFVSPIISEPINQNSVLLPVEAKVKQYILDYPKVLFSCTAKQFGLTVKQVREIKVSLVHEFIKIAPEDTTDGDVASKFGISITGAAKIRRHLGIKRYGVAGKNAKHIMRERRITGIKKNLKPEELLKWLTEDGLGLRECGARLGGVSRERVRQIINEFGFGDFESRRKPSWYAIKWRIPEFAEPEKLLQEVKVSGISAVLDKLNLRHDYFLTKMTKIGHPINDPIVIKGTRPQIKQHEHTCASCGTKFMVLHGKHLRMLNDEKKTGSTKHYCPTCCEKKVWIGR